MNKVTCKVCEGTGLVDQVVTDYIEWSFNDFDDEPPKVIEPNQECANCRGRGFKYIRNRADK